VTRRAHPSRVEIEATAPVAEVLGDAMAVRQHPALERVPHLPELVQMGLADVVAWNAKREPTHYRARPAGQQLLNEIMSRNAAKVRAMSPAERLEVAVYNIRRRSA
jgi:hypothetical protein